jgi:hypothetical protein
LARKFRKQKVALRFKRREQLKHRLRAVGVRGVALALLVGFGVGLVTGGDSFASRFMRRHTPQIDLAMPPSLAGLPVLSEFPKNPFWLWFPGSGFWLERRVCRRYPAVRSLRLERRFSANRLTAHVEPRIPLVVWNGSGFDQEGVLFPVTPGAWKTLPEADFPVASGKRDLGRWLARMAAMDVLWPQVTSVRQGPSGSMELSLSAGASILWGPPESDPSSAKAQALTRVLDDAHQHLGGAASADLRFFEQGRIIVRPKGR